MLDLSLIAVAACLTVWFAALCDAILLRCVRPRVGLPNAEDRAVVLEGLANKLACTVAMHEVNLQLIYLSITLEGVYLVEEHLERAEGVALGIEAISPAWFEVGQTKRLKEIKKGICASPLRGIVGEERTVPRAADRTLGHHEQVEMRARRAD